MKYLQSELLKAGQGEKIVNLISDGILSEELELTEKGSRLILSIATLEQLDALNEIALKHIAIRNGDTAPTPSRKK